MRGDYAALWYDKETGDVFPELRGSWGGFGGSTLCGHIYRNEGSGFAETVSFHSTTMFYAGAAPDEIWLVTEAYHADGRLEQTVAPMSGEKLKSLPRTEVNHTLISYSNYHLSAGSGYGI